MSYLYVKGEFMKSKYNSREYLLKQAKDNIPVIHPRYQALYRNLYDVEQEKNSSSLSIRILLCLILFAVYAAALNSEKTVAIDAANQIVNEIGSTISFLSF